MKNKHDLIMLWLKKAEKDLVSAQHEMSFPDAVRESICFHSQQAVEKALKAYLVYLDINFTKTHEIGELISNCTKKDKEMASLFKEADNLTDYAVQIRYPDSPAEPSQEDATQALKIAYGILQYIKEKVNT